MTPFSELGNLSTRSVSASVIRASSTAMSPYRNSAPSKFTASSRKNLSSAADVAST